jgi:hypothetical protein
MCHGHLAREEEQGQDGQITNILAMIREWYFGNGGYNGIVTDKYNSKIQPRISPNELRCGR